MCILQMMTMVIIHWMTTMVIMARRSWKKQRRPWNDDHREWRPWWRPWSQNPPNGTILHVLVFFFPCVCVFSPAVLGRRNFDELKALIMDDSVVLKDHDMCFTHKCQCRRIPDPKRSRSQTLLELLLAGSSCVDWSSFGKHGGDAGASAAAFIVLTLDDK